MKLIITESQYKLILENEGDNLMDLTKAYKGGLILDKMDSYFLFMNKKKETDYQGYYIDDDIFIENGKKSYE